MSGPAQVVVVTGASSGFGNLTARALAEAGHHVYAGMRATTGRNAPAVADLDAFSEERGLHVTAVEMDVQDQESVDAAVARIEAERGRLDTVVHNAGHMVLGPAEAFTPEGLADRLAALSVGARLFGDEVRAGMAEKENDLRERVGLTLHGHTPELSEGRPALADHGTDGSATREGNH